MRSSIRSEHGRPRRNAGLSLVETITAFVVAVAAISAALHGHMRVMDAMRAMREDNLAREALINELETLRSLPFPELETGAALPFRSGTGALAPLHEARATVSILPADLPGLVEVRVQVVWIGDRGRTITRSLTTRFADHGGHDDV